MHVHCFVGGRKVDVGGGVATYTGFQPAIDTDSVFADGGCSNRLRLGRQLVSNRG